MTTSTRSCIRHFLNIALLTLTVVGIAHPSQAQIASDDIITNGNWWRNCASLDLDFYNDQYYINSNSSTGCDGTVGTVYSGAAYGTNIMNFITATGSTFTRAATNTAVTSAPFYLSGVQTFNSRAAVTNTFTSTFAPFYLATGQTFTSRAGTTATYYNSSGVITSTTANTARSNYTYNGSSWVLAGTLIEPAATNLIIQSAAIGVTSWTNSQLTAASGTAAPDGTTKAVTLTDNATNAAHDTAQTVSALTIDNPYTLSVYLQAGTDNWARLQFGSGTNTVYAFFNLSTGSVGTVASSGLGMPTPTASIQNVGNGWFRCIMTFNPNVASGSAAIYMANSNGDMGSAGTGSGTIYAWGAQPEAGVTATSYIATTTATVARSADVYNQQPSSYFDSTGTLNFATANTARTNYTYNGSSWINSGTLVEPTATNSITNNMMVGVVAADGLERTNNGTFNTTSPNACSGSTTSSTNSFSCSSGVAVTPQTMSSISFSTTTATVTTSTAHGLAVGNVVTISGATPSNYNGTFVVATVPTTTTFTYVMGSSPGANASPVGSYTATQADGEPI